MILYDTSYKAMVRRNVKLKMKVRKWECSLRDKVWLRDSSFSSTMSDSARKV